MYYLLETNYATEPTAYRTSSLVEDFSFEPSDWLSGDLMGQPEEEICVEFWNNGGDGLAEVLLDSIPLFSKNLLSALEEAGVDNLQTYPAIAVSKDGKHLSKDYLAVNILGHIRCADLEKSQYSDITGTGLFAVNFRKLIIDEKKAKGQYMFRLAESVSSIIVHESVKQVLDQKGFSYLSFRALN